MTVAACFVGWWEAELGGVDLASGRYGDGLRAGVKGKGVGEVVEVEVDEEGRRFLAPGRRGEAVGRGVCSCRRQRLDLRRAMKAGDVGRQMPVPPCAGGDGAAQGEGGRRGRDREGPRGP